jgi:hypothetical protein
MFANILLNLSFMFILIPPEIVVSRNDYGIRWQVHPAFCDVGEVCVCLLS